MGEFNYELIEHIAQITSGGNWNKELNIISWNGREEKFDIRDWKADHSMMGKGVSLTREELITLYEAIKIYLEGETTEEEILYNTQMGREISFIGNGSSKIQVINNIFLIDRIKNINDLFEVLLKCWGKETVNPQYKDEYIKDNDPTFGQDDITVMLVYDLFGGNIYKGIRDDGEVHYYNVVNNVLIDLTSDQLTLYDIEFEYLKNNRIDRDYFDRNKNVVDRYELLIKKIKEL